MEAGQVTAALGLLRKCVPDLKASDDTLSFSTEKDFNITVNFPGDGK